MGIINEVFEKLGVQLEVLQAENRHLQAKNDLLTEKIAKLQKDNEYTLAEISDLLAQADGLCQKIDGDKDDIYI
jgi:cell division protein FtsB